MKKHIRKLQGLSYGNSIHHFRWAPYNQTFLRVNPSGTNFCSMNFEHRAEDILLVMSLGELEDASNALSRFSQI